MVNLVDELAHRKTVYDELTEAFTSNEAHHAKTVHFSVSSVFILTPSS